MIKKLFTAVALFCATTVSSIAQTTNPYAPKWTKNGFYFTANAENTENTLTMTVRATIDGVRCDSAFEIGVFVGNRCVVRNNLYSSTKYYERHGYYTTLNVKANANEMLSFRIYDHRNEVEVLCSEPPTPIKFTANGKYGSITSGTYELTFKGSTTHSDKALVIDDATDLSLSGNQYSITANGIACSYTRNAYLDGGYETIVLPFDADITEIKASGFVFEKFEGFGNNTIKFVELAQNENLKAGVPYLFRYSGTPSADRQEIEFVADANRVSGDIIATEGWTGTFKYMNGNEIAGKYILNTDGDMMQIAGSGASLKPYHCYLELVDDANVSTLSVSHRRNTADVESMTIPNDSEEIYDMSGRKLDKMPQSGIVIKNNKKIYIK